MRPSSSTKNTASGNSSRTSLQAWTDDRSMTLCGLGPTSVKIHVLRGELAAPAFRHCRVPRIQADSARPLHGSQCVSAQKCSSRRRRLHRPAAAFLCKAAIASPVSMRMVSGWVACSLDQGLRDGRGQFMNFDTPGLILHVEDERPVREAVSMLLGSGGYP